MLPVLDYMIAFKPELGLLLQRMVEAYNLLFIDQFSGYYKNDHHKQEALKKRTTNLDD